ncbi:MAG: secondary thiamine-phosphate synthase enzyme YjbQ [Polyangiaceae bacterium]
MPTYPARIELESQGHADVIDITDRVRDAVKRSGVRSGLACVFVPGATGGVTTIEFEPGCVADLATAFERVAPSRGDYEHERRWHDGNGHSHVRAALLGPSLTVPIVEHELTLGTWQQIVFVDFDNRSRCRSLVLQIVGDA